MRLAVGVPVSPLNGSPGLKAGLGQKNARPEGHPCTGLSRPSRQRRVEALASGHKGPISAAA